MWMMEPRDGGEKREVNPDFSLAYEGNAFSIGFPTTQRRYYLFEDGTGRFGRPDYTYNETLTWSFVVPGGGESTGDMPDLVGMHRVEARNLLGNMLLELDIEMVPEQNGENRDVVIRTVPRAGEPLTRGSTVQIVYSMGS